MYTFKKVKSKTLFFVGIFEVTDKKNRIRRAGSVSRRYGSEDPDLFPCQNITNLEHCSFFKKKIVCQICSVDFASAKPFIRGIAHGTVIKIREY
jgi:hypothetical protein